MDTAYLERIGYRRQSITMLLQPKPIAFTVAVIGFFALSIVGSVGGLSPYTCSKRALLGAVVAYWAASMATRAINTILTRAMIASQANKDRARDTED
jgi:hypothetical protein